MGQSASGLFCIFVLAAMRWDQPFSVQLAWGDAQKDVGRPWQHKSKSLCLENHLERSRNVAFPLVPSSSRSLWSPLFFQSPLSRCCLGVG